VLAPIGEHARTTPPQGLHGSTASARDTTNILLNQQQPQIMDSSTTADANYPAQSHQSAQVQDAPTTEQIQEPLPTAPTAPMEASAADPVERKAVQSPLHIKDEPSQTPREHTPAQTTSAKETTLRTKNLDSDTLKAIEAAKNDFSFRERSSKAKQSIEDSVSTTAAIPTTEAPVSKKRPAPTSSRNRKGMAVVKKPAAKKRKVDNESPAAGSNVRRSATPSSRNGTSKTPGFRGGKNSASQTPAGSSPAPDFLDDGDEEAGSDDSSGEVFCICRRGDNHTYMIACDGGCEDWFHGKCVHIREEDGDLIDKYICPSCSEKSGSVTTWLPMCRREGCRRPARLKKGSASKYCSDECGVLFMRTLVEKSAGGAGSAGAGQNSKNRNRRKANRADEDGNEGDSDEDDLGPRGGALRPSELKALVIGAPDIASFRALGEGVLSPPQTVSPTSGNFPDSAKLTNGSNGESYTLNSSETQTINDFNAKKDLLRTRRALLRDREKFVGMTREQVQRYAEREGIKPKDVCGYDSRLAWPEETFDKWRKSPTGIAALRLGTLDGASTQPTANGITPPKSEGEAGDEGPAPTENNSDGMGFDVEKEVQMCTRKRCERHRLWQKQALSDVRFEESTLADQMRQLEREEREVREGAMLRWRKEVGGAGGVKEGWVEVVGEAMDVDG
jgi:COMPASS component SPP1